MFSWQKIEFRGKKKKPVRKELQTKPDEIKIWQVTLFTHVHGKQTTDTRLRLKNQSGRRLTRKIQRERNDVQIVPPLHLTEMCGKTQDIRYQMLELAGFSVVSVDCCYLLVEIGRNEEIVFDVECFIS